MVVVGATEICWNIFDIILTVHHDKLYNKTKEMHFLEFYSDNILYMFRIAKLFIFRRQFYCTFSLWYVSCIYVTNCYHDRDGTVPSRSNCLLKMNILPIRNMYRMLSE